MLAIETKNLTKKFNNFTAVDALNLNVPQGSIYGFLGPNGAGKTTTIKMLTGLSKPTAGEVHICGKEVSFGSLKNRTEFGFLPDVPNFYDWMRPMEFLLFSGELYAMEPRDLKKRAEELMELVGLGGVKKKIGGFSRGMKQRLGIAQALIHQPKVIFLDEPTSALDPIGRKEVMDIIGKLSGKVTVFLSSHILSDIERICDRIVILDHGCIKIEDTIENLKTKFGKKGIVFEIGQGEKADAVVEQLRNLPWVEGLKRENGEITIHTSQLDRAQTQIPAILSSEEVPLRKFNLLESTLEDVFMKVVNKE